MSNILSKQQRFEGCIVGGAIGDAWGSAYENIVEDNDATTFYWGGKKQTKKHWAITDDTQLTLITCEALAANKTLTINQPNIRMVK